MLISYEREMSRQHYNICVETLFRKCLVYGCTSTVLSIDRHVILRKRMHTLTHICKKGMLAFYFRLDVFQPRLGAVVCSSEIKGF